MRFGIDFLLIAAACAAVALCATIAAAITRRWAVRVILILLAAAAFLPAAGLSLVLHPEWIDDRFHAYKKFYRDIRVGMTRGQVVAELERHYPASGSRKRPTIMDDSPTSLDFFHESRGFPGTKLQRNFSHS